MFATIAIYFHARAKLHSVATLQYGRGTRSFVRQNTISRLLRLVTTVQIRLDRLSYQYNREELRIACSVYRVTISVIYMFFVRSGALRI